MNEYKTIIEKARSLFSEDEKTYHWRGGFVSLSADLHVMAFQKKALQPVSLLLKNIIQDVWNIGTIIHRLVWMHKKSLNDQFLEQMWMFYAGIDIEHFHIEIRSIMDYVAETLSEVSNKKGQVPTSFRKLSSWVSENPGNRKRIGNDLAEVVDTAEWFHHIRKIRDAVIHRGGYTLVFGKPQDGILFQVYEKMSEKIISLENIMFNENVVIFDRYAAFYFSQLLLFLENLSEKIHNRLGMPYLIKESSCSSYGFSTIVKWLDNLVSILDDNPQNNP